MNKIDNSEVVVEKEKRKNKLITAYRIPMVGGASYYGVASTETPVAPDGGGSGATGGGE